MTVLRRIAAIPFAAAMAALVFAAPASAIVPPADGYYTFTEAGRPGATWTLQSLCTQANGTRAQPDYTDQTIQTLGCSVMMGSQTADTATAEERAVNFNGSAVLTSGLWTITTKVSEGFKCPDGSFAPSTDTYAFSEVTLTGTHTSMHDAVCGQAPGMTKVPFALAFTGPLDPPVENRFPMKCNYLVGRPSICA
ncbi:hypothetical protein [Mycolicibacterium mengxianglii]|uniref:hypothetical protein n=1 Tax=Mycolicibacterium mengxianglii TaxID=2736649 RepID=UPI0018D19C28|nr:hypothetical protein [Mycolicibacterium mengxianglii]